MAEVTSTQEVINNQSITNFNEESIIECVDETLNETVDETLNEAINETFNEAINETFNDTNLIEDEDELFLVLQPPQQVSTLNFLNSVDFFEDQLSVLRPDVANSLPCWLSQFSVSKLRQPTI